MNGGGITGERMAMHVGLKKGFHHLFQYHILKSVLGRRLLDCDRQNFILGEMMRKQSMTASQEGFFKQKTRASH